MPVPKSTMHGFGHVVAERYEKIATSRDYCQWTFVSDTADTRTSLSALFEEQQASEIRVHSRPRMDRIRDPIFCCWSCTICSLNFNQADPRIFSLSSSIRVQLDSLRRWLSPPWVPAKYIQISRIFPETFWHSRPPRQWNNKHLIIPHSFAWRKHAPRAVGNGFKAISGKSLGIVTMGLWHSAVFKCSNSPGFQHAKLKDVNRKMCQYKFGATGHMNWLLYVTVVAKTWSRCCRWSVSPFDYALVEQEDARLRFHVARLPCAWLVGGLEHFLFSHILGIIIPID